MINCWLTFNSPLFNPGFTQYFQRRISLLVPHINETENKIVGLVPDKINRFQFWFWKTDMGLGFHTFLILGGVLVRVGVMFHTFLILGGVLVRVRVMFSSFVVSVCTYSCPLSCVLFHFCVVAYLFHFSQLSFFFVFATSTMCCQILQWYYIDVTY